VRKRGKMECRKWVRSAGKRRDKRIKKEEGKGDENPRL